jgi:hypothetical protein
MLQGKMYERHAAGKMMFEGSVYDPNQHKWLHNVRLEVPAH